MGEWWSILPDYLWSDHPRQILIPSLGRARDVHLMETSNQRFTKPSSPWLWELCWARRRDKVGFTTKIKATKSVWKKSNIHNGKTRSYSNTHTHTQCKGTLKCVVETSIKGSKILDGNRTGGNDPLLNQMLFKILMEWRDIWRMADAWVTCLPQVHTSD